MNPVDSTHCLNIDKAPSGLVIYANELDLPSPFEDSDFDFYDHNYCQWIQPEFEVLVENVVYIAGFVVRKIMKKIVCDICRQSLVSCYIEKQYE